MRVKLIILILQTLKHFNNVFDRIEFSTTNWHSEPEYEDIKKKLSKEIKYQESKLVK